MTDSLGHTENHSCYSPAGVQTRHDHMVHRDNPKHHILLLAMCGSKFYIFLPFSLVGGYGYVFIAQDMQTGVDYALKVLILANECGFVQV